MGTNDPTKGHWLVRRFMLPVIVGMLSLATLLPDAYGQGQPGATDKGKMRVLAIARTPLADEHLSEGGLIVALVRASLAESGPGDYAGAELDLRWAKAEPTAPQPDAQRTEVTVPVEGPNCDEPNALTQSLAMLCDGAVFSDAMLKVIVGLFAPAKGAFKFDTDKDIVGKTICVAQDHDVASLNGGGRSWVSLKQVTVLRRQTLLDCIAEVQVGAADAFAAPDLEGRFLLTRLGLGEVFAMQARPLATRGVHAVVSRDHPNADELIGAINRGLKKLKDTGTHSTIVQKHLTRLWDGSAARLPPPAFATTAAVAKPGTGRKLKDPAGAASPDQEPKAPPVLSTADRARALRFMKKGDEELGDGRVASARVLYERSAEMGIARAAMALAGTYDADELEKLGLINVQPDATLAKRWYERALVLGVKEAGQRLQRLVGANTKSP